MTAEDPASADTAAPDTVTAAGSDGSSAPAPRPLDLVSATTLVAASMIGAGIWTTSGFTLGDLGSRWLVMAAWGTAGVIAICGAVCYAGLAGEFTESGGEYLFLSRALHPVAGVMAGWVSLLAGFTGAIAFAATTFAQYAIPLLPRAIGENESATTNIAAAVILAAALLHAVGVKPGARTQDVVVVLKFLLIAAFVLFAAVTTSEWKGSTASQGADDHSTWIGLRFATALMWISLSFSGFNAAVYVAGEVKQPKRNVPRAIVGGTLLVTIAYLLLNVVFMFATPAHEIRFQEQVATISAHSIGGESFEFFTRVIILVCLFTSVSALVMSGPRVYSKMAEDGFLPAWLKFENRPPANAILLQAVLAIVVVSITTLRGLLDYLGFTLSVSAALTASLLLLPRGVSAKIPLYPLPVIVFVTGTLMTAGLAAYRDPVQAIVGVGTILLGAILYPFYVSRHA